jgi:predicted HAD superfamily Cof-like phosphohydrolase
MSAEFSRRVNIEVFKDEPKTREEFRVDAIVTNATWPNGELDERYRKYLDDFQPYWWHAQSPNGEILTNGEHYLHEDGATNSAEVLFGDDTTMYWAPMYGEDRHFRLLRYGKTDRDHQAAAALSLLDGTTEFMRAACQLDAPPTFTDDAVRDLRVELLKEEYREWVNAEIADDLVEVVDGLLDVIVIAWGSLLAYVGEEKAKAAAAEVVRSNLDKIGPDGKCVKRAAGKILKPEGWQAPDIAGALA